MHQLIFCLLNALQIVSKKIFRNKYQVRNRPIHVIVQALLFINGLLYATLKEVATWLYFIDTFITDAITTAVTLSIVNFSERTKNSFPL